MSNLRADVISEQCDKFVNAEPTYSIRTRFLKRNLQMLDIRVADSVAQLDWETSPLDGSNRAFQAALAPGQGVLVAGNKAIAPFLISCYEVRNKDFDEFLSSDLVPFLEDVKDWSGYKELIFKSYDLRLMSSVNDLSGISTGGMILIIVAAVDNVLHFRIFDGDGKVVVDTDEKRLTEQAWQIEDLRKQLESLWPSHELTTSEKSRVITAVTSIVGHTHPLSWVAIHRRAEPSEFKQRL